MDQSEDLSLHIECATRLNGSAKGTSLPDQSTMRVQDTSSRKIDHSGNSTLFLAERAARVNARSRSNRIYTTTDSLDTTSTSMLDRGTVSVHSSRDTTVWSPFSYSSHSQQPLQRHETPFDLGHLSSELLISLDGENVPIAESDSSFHGQIERSGGRAHIQTDSSTRSSNFDFEPILPPTSMFSLISATPSSMPRPRGASLADAREVLPSHTPVRMNLPAYASRLLKTHENSQPARRTRTISHASHNSSSDSTNDSRGSNDSRDARDCSYCLSVNKNAIGHNKHNCPVLAHLPPCRICHASGKYNHTESHCPFQVKEYLEFIPKERRTTHPF